MSEEQLRPRPGWPLEKLLRYEVPDDGRKTNKENDRERYPCAPTQGVLFQLDYSLAISFINTYVISTEMFYRYYLLSCFLSV